jgi:hypothetical protein
LVTKLTERIKVAYVTFGTFPHRPCAAVQRVAAPPITTPPNKAAHRFFALDVIPTLLQESFFAVSCASRH